MSNMTPKHESEGKQTDVAYECTCVRSEFECSNPSLNSKLTIHMNSESEQVVHEGHPSYNQPQAESEYKCEPCTNENA